MPKLFSFLIACCGGISLGGGILAPWVGIVQAAPTAETPAVSCRAASLELAANLRWDHLRVWNESSGEIWVVCPVTNNTEAYRSSDDEFHFYGPATATVYAWFDASAAADSEVRCTWSDLTSTASGGSVSNAVTHTILAPATLPGTTSQSFDLNAFNGYQSGTITCKLDPHTGINSYSMMLSRQLL